MKTRARNAGFTVFELLIVITIILILAAILMPVLAGAKKSAYAPVEESNMRQLYIGMTLYAADHDDEDPLLLGDTFMYVKEKNVYQSPRDIFRVPTAAGKWPKALFISDHGVGDLKVSYAYLRSVTGLEGSKQYHHMRDESGLAVMSSQWLGEPTDYMAPGMKDFNGLLVLTIDGPIMQGPILKIRADGSLLRSPKHEHPGMIWALLDTFGTKH